MASADAVDVRRLRRGALVAGVGDGVAAVALPLLAANVTRDPLAVAAVVAAQHLPWALLALARPALASVDRRTLAGAGNSLRAVAVGLVGLLAVVGDETILTIQLVALVLGLAQAVTDDAERVGGEALDGRGQGGAHRTLAGAGLLGVALLGLPAGGFLYEILPSVPFLGGVGVFAVAALFVLSLRRPLKADESWSGGGWSPRPPPGAGVVMAAAAVGSGASGAVLGVLVLIALDDLGLGAPAFGLLLAGLAVSALVGALLAPSVGRVAGLRAGIALWSLAAAAGHVGAWSLLDPEAPVPSAVALGAGGGAAMAAGVLLRAQLHGAARGAVGADGLRAFHVAVWSATPLGAVVAGWAARPSDAADVLLGAAAAHVVAGVLGALTRTRMVRADEPAPLVTAKTP